MIFAVYPPLSLLRPEEVHPVNVLLALQPHLHHVALHGPVAGVQHHHKVPQSLGKHPDRVRRSKGTTMSL